MKNILTILTALGLLAACKKEGDFPEKLPEPEKAPKMTYTDLKNLSVPFNKSFKCDVNNDKRPDFYITTTLVGKPAEQSDSQCFFFNGAFFTYSPVNDFEQMPVLSEKEAIGPDTFSGFQWYNASQLLLSEKVVPLKGSPYWQGNWKDASQKYVPFGLMIDQKLHYGWIALSFDKEHGAVILHKAALCEEPGKTVKAGA